MRKIVLATSIAETSLTIEGVRIVIDSGLARRPVYEPGVGLTRLETQRASRASVDQRRGRAGRTEPGVCYRLWDEGETRGLAPFERPEILDADLSGLALDLAAWGVSEPAALNWLDPPPAAAWREARELLSALGALDADARLTTHGAALADFGIHPRLAHMLIRSGALGQARLAGQIAAILTEQGLGGPSPDLAQRLIGFARDRSPRAEGARRLAQRWVRAAGGGAQAEPDAALAGQTLALAFPERVAKARDGRGAFLMANGRAAALDAGEGLASKPFLAIASVSGSAERARIQLAAELTPLEIEAAFGAEIVEDDTLSLDGPTGAVRARRVRRLGKITLSEAPLSAPPQATAAAVLLDALKRKGPSGLAWPPAAQTLRARVALLKSLEPARWPDWTDQGLESAFDAWAEAAVSGAMSLAQVEANLHDALRSQLDYGAQRALDAMAPTHFTTPAGFAHPIDYENAGGPTVEVRVQEMFGEARHPTIADGRVALILALTSPANRPVQTTRDLPGFWKGSYAGVRSEMRGRYPKHPWPDDPVAAEPTRRAKPRGS
jgi:ATP-dependent helicase HrpB